MGAVTYPNPEVERFIEEHFIPVQFNVVEQPEIMEQLNASWTPTLIVQDARGREHRRSQGYLDPARFLGEMSLAWLKDAIDRKDFATAHNRAHEVMDRTKGDAAREPEALYWHSVAAYKKNEDPQHLMDGWNRLLDQFPDSEWAKRAEFIRQ